MNRASHFWRYFWKFELHFWKLSREYFWKFIVAPCQLKMLNFQMNYIRFYGKIVKTVRFSKFCDIILLILTKQGYLHQLRDGDNVCSCHGVRKSLPLIANIQHSPLVYISVVTNFMLYLQLLGFKNIFLWILNLGSKRKIQKMNTITVEEFEPSINGVKSKSTWGNLKL